MIKRARLNPPGLPTIGIGLRSGTDLDGITVRVNYKIIASEEWRRDSITKHQLANILRELADKVDAA